MIRRLALAASTLIFPGLGHWLLGKKGRAAVYCFCVLSMAGVGLSLHGSLFPLRGEGLLFGLGSFAEGGLGLLYVVLRLLHVAPLDSAHLIHSGFGYGATFLVSAGLMNMLLIMDVHDIQLGRRD